MSVTPERGLAWGVAALAGAVLLLGAALARALTTAVPEAPPTTQVATAAAPEVPALTPSSPPPEDTPTAAEDRERSPATPRTAPPLSMQALALAVENDPFQHDRKRPAERYVLPSDRIVEEPEPEPPPPPPFRIIGTASSASGGLAVVQVEEMMPRVVALGETLAGYTLESVDADSATLVGDGRTLTLPVTAAPVEPPRPRARAGQRGRGPQPNTRERQMDVLEAIRRQMAERGGVPQDIEIQDGRVIIRPRVNRDTLDARLPRVP